MDRVLVQVRFRKGIFTCPDCGQEDIVDWSMDGGNTYENNCSNCGKWNNSFKNYSGNVSFPKEEYETLKQEDIETKKMELIDKFIYDYKNPPPYVEPTKEELEEQKENLEEMVAELTEKISLKEVEIVKEIN